MGNKSPDHWTVIAIRLCLYSLFFFTPFLLYFKSFELFEFNKMIFVYLLTAFIITLWLLKTIIERQFCLTWTQMAVPIVIYLLANIVTSVTSIDRHTSLFGYYSRFNGGLLSTICYTILFFAFVTFGNDRKFLIKTLRVLILSSVIVSVYAILERMGIDKNFWVQDVQARVFSTFGQPNWLAAFLAMVIPVQIALFSQITSYRSKFIQFIGISVNYLAFTFTYSRGGMLGLLVAFVVLGIGMIHLRALTRSGITCIFALIVLVFVLFGNALLRDSQFHGLVNLVAPVQLKQSADSQLDKPGTESSQIRLIVWKGAWNIFLHHPFVGTGVETFAYAYYQYRPAAHNQTTEWDFIYNKAHNEYLNELATKGIVGFASYIWLIGAFLTLSVSSIWFSAKKSFKHKLNATSSTYQVQIDRDEKMTVLALLAGYVSYLIQNIFGFSVVMISVLFFLFPAIAVVTLAMTRQYQWPIRFFAKQWIRSAGYIATFLVATFLISFVVRLWIADLYYAQGYNEALNGYATTAYEDIFQAVSFNMGEPLYQSQLGYIAAQLVDPAIEQKNAALSSQLKIDAIGFTSQALATSPVNIQYLRNATKTYSILGMSDQNALRKALTIAEKLVKYSPTDPQDRLRIAALYTELNQPSKAKQAYDKAISLKPDYREARLRYADFLVRQAGVNDTITDASSGPDQNNNTNISIDPRLLKEAVGQLQYYLDHYNNQDEEFKQKIASLSAIRP